MKKIVLLLFWEYNCDGKAAAAASEEEEEELQADQH